MKSIQILAFSFLMLHFANAQEFKIGKVSIAELEEKKHPKDTAAVAAVLFSKGEVSYTYAQESGFIMVTNTTVRLKIYKKEGYVFATKRIPYYIGTGLRENVTIEDAFTYNLVGGQIVKTKLKKEGIFDEEQNKYWSEKKITLPEIKEGCVIEYSYTVRSPRIDEMKEWNFQSGIPVNYSKFTTRIPEYFIYKANYKGYVFPKKVVTNNSRILSFTYTEDAKDGSKPMHYNEAINYSELETNYLAENLPAIKEEGFVNNINNYVSGVTHELTSTKYPYQAIKNYSTDWSSVTKTIYKYDSFGDELNKSGYYEDDVKQAISGIVDDNGKIAAIFNLVKSKVKWNNFAGFGCINGVRNAYKTGSGNAAEINLMLTSMLRYAGISANPVLISTRDNGIAFFPTINAFNFVIAAIETQQGYWLLDATDPYSLPNILPERDLNWNGRLVRKDGSSEAINLMPTQISNKNTQLQFAIEANGNIQGKARFTYTDYEAHNYRVEQIAKANDTYFEWLENKLGGIEIDNHKRENETNLGKPIVEEFSFTKNQAYDVINDKIYVSPLVLLNTKDNPFKQEEREYPVDFGYPTQEKWLISIKIPEGYTVETMPEPINLSGGTEVGRFVYNISQKEGAITLVGSIDLVSAIVAPQYYPALKEFYQKMVEKQNEKIVLKKI